MRPLGSPNKLVRSIAKGANDPYSAELEKRQLGCSYQQKRGCVYCPHFAKCRRWWDILCGRLGDTRMKDEEYVVYVVEFERIRNNGDKKEIKS